MNHTVISSAPWVAGLLLLLAGQLGASGCAAPGKAAQSAGSPAPEASAAVAVPFSLCRGFGAAGTPCYPTNVDIGSRAVSPCRERQRGHCERSGPSGMMACLLAPVPDGKACGTGHVCKDGACLAE
jgi:hypothetical protein